MTDLAIRARIYDELLHTGRALDVAGEILSETPPKELFASLGLKG